MKVPYILFISLATALLSACGGGSDEGTEVTQPIVEDPPVQQPADPTYEVGGVVSGLSNGQLVLANNMSDEVTLQSEGEFSFTTEYTEGDTFSVAIKTQPNGYSCEVENGSGTVGTNDIDDVSVSCEEVNTPITFHSVGGSVQGLEGSELTLRSSLSEELTVSQNGNFVFSNQFENGSNYQVFLTIQPENHSCTISNANGTVNGSNVSNVLVACESIEEEPQPEPNEYSIGGSVEGLGQSPVVLTNNASDELSISENGSFVFTQLLIDDETYDVSVQTQPTDYTCFVGNGAGTVNGQNINDVAVSCEANEDLFSVGGSISGLNQAEIVLETNLSDVITVDSDGGFSFPASFTDGSNYQVFVQTQPQAQTCGIENASGTINGNNVNNVAVACEDTTHDIVYVRYPNGTDEDPYVDIPQGEHAYDIAGGADLMLLKADGSEVVLVDCDQCSVMDPFISFDGNTVYYSLIVEPTPESASWIYKINLDDTSYTPIRLTFDDGFDSSLYAHNDSPEHDKSSVRSIRDMAPAPLADGRIVFTSNRSALTTFRPGTDALVDGSVQQLYVMDDHDGSANTKELSNLRLLETGNLHLVQHPFQLKDGRIMFSTWQDAATKYNYAMTSLFTIYPDGTNLMQFTEPHDHNKNLDHFATQLPDESIVSGYYYPSFDYGFGILMKYPIASDGPDFLRENIQQTYTWGDQRQKVSSREFDRKESLSITPHTISLDRPAPNLSGKYSMPSIGVRGDMLVAYSAGSVNHFQSVCNGEVNLCEELRSGIYLIKDAANTIITDPAALIKIKDDPNYNEIWPRVVASYFDLYGQDTPDLIGQQPLDSRLEEGEAAGIVGSSSMLNREPLNEDEPDPFKPLTSRERNDGNWRIEGAEAGVFEDSDVYGVRIIVSPPRPFTKPIRKGQNSDDWDLIEQYLESSRLKAVVARYGALHQERWEILGEFPLTNTDSIDQQGNPDTSWAAKVPADTPFLIQTIDKNGMTLVSELTWRGLKPGEKRVDCGGCHAHSIEPLDYESTQSGSNSPITTVANLDLSDPMIQEGIWDLTQGEIPLLDNVGVTKELGHSYGVEYNRDILPIINQNCTSCHTSGGEADMLILDGSGTAQDAYEELTTDSEGKYTFPQVSKYIRTPQARQSLLAWVAWGKRLDGRDNQDRDDDVDYPANHPTINLTDAEKRNIARWIDLGSPIDFPELQIDGGVGFRYTDDYQLPVVNIHRPFSGSNDDNTAIIGLADAKSGIDWETVLITVYPISNPSDITVIATYDRSTTGVITFELPSLSENQDHVLSLQVKDLEGNANIQTVRFSLD
ncbi:hypothetical protein [Brumicola blandensis]|uniref:Hydrazine synthase alpha subunit middle domain-containing protein n=1 Tax=Brumicola blandensis TaxID=3075611 RepID=A0AAW8R457_9ALTE|nr:hypothetical protein [Alteromonas sp. W409]MDT0582630.1 hypothetical protein [Alteromonas sp. W409]